MHGCRRSQKWLLMLWVRRGRTVVSVVGQRPSFPHEACCLLPVTDHTCCWIRGILFKLDRGSPFRIIVVSSLRVLNLVIVYKKIKRYSWTDRYYWTLAVGPNESAESKSTSDSHQDDGLYYVVRNPLNKECKRRRTRAHVIHVSSAQMVTYWSEETMY